MVFIKKMEKGNQGNFSDDDYLNFKKGTKYSYDQKIWVITEEISSGSDEFRRSKSTNSEDDEICELRSLQSLSKEKEFYFIKES